MNLVNLATIVSVIVMLALGIYFLLWMSKSQKRAAAEYREQQAAVQAARDADDAVPDGSEAPDQLLLDVDRLTPEEQDRSSASV